MRENTIVTFRSLPDNLVEGVPVENADAADLAELQAAARFLKEADVTPGVMNAPDHQLISQLQAFLARKAREEDKPLEPLHSGGAEAKFDNHDWLGWAGSFFTWIKGLDKHAWSSTPDRKELASSFRLALFGDWGTGLYGAPTTSDTIANDAQGYQAVLHLGDVYYAGDVDEVEERFLAHWPEVPGAVHRACNSNHEMYTGGHGYFGKTLPKFGQSASYFELRNDYWILAGLDTGYDDGNLAGGQVPWLHNLASEAGNRRIILFSHHQPYSAFERGYDNVTRKLRELLEARKIFGWYWGHEHRCVLFDSHPIWGLHGRCVGHGGYPYFRNRFEGTAVRVVGDAAWYRIPGDQQRPAALALDGPNPYVAGHSARYGVQGHMSLHFDGPRLLETVHAPEGTVLWEREIGT